MHGLVVYSLSSLLRFKDVLLRGQMKQNFVRSTILYFCRTVKDSSKQYLHYKTITFYWCIQCHEIIRSLFFYFHSIPSANRIQHEIWLLWLNAVLGIPKSDSALSWTVLSLIRDSSQIASALSWTAVRLLQRCPGQHSAIFILSLNKRCLGDRPIKAFCGS